MKKNKVFALMTASLLVVSGCSTDVLGNKAVESFNKIAEKEASYIEVEELEPEKTVYRYTLSDNSSSFFWGDKTGISVDIKPFKEAGLDISKLPKEMIEADKLIIEFEQAESKAGEDSNKAFKSFVKDNRDAVGYHAQLDHFGIKLGNGNMFEWAQDIEKNDKDVVFVINPEMIAGYGADVTKIEGWVYADVEMMNDKGEKIIEKKLLKPFDLE